MPSPLFIGIDVSHKENVVCCLTPQEEKRPLCRFSVTNNLPGILELQKRVNSLVKKHGFEHILFGLEHTGCYSSPVAMYLHQLPFDCPDSKVYAFNPSIIKNYQKSHYLDAPRNDRVAAWFIAAKLRDGHLPHPYTWNEPLLALQRLTRARLHLIDDMTRHTNVLLTNLFLTFIDYSNGPFEKDKLSPTSLAVMEEFDSAENLVNLSLDELVAFLIKHSRNNFKDPVAVAQTLQKAARSSYRLPELVTGSVNLAIASLIRVIRTIKEQVKSLDKAIADHLATFPQTLDTVSGIGPVFASGILAEIGDIHQFKSHREVAKFAGLAWTENQSGDFKAAQTRLIKSGNRYLKYYLVEAANSVRVHDPVFARYYAQKLAENKTFAHKRALALTARKLVRLVDSLLRTNRIYVPQGGMPSE